MEEVAEPFKLIPRYLVPSYFDVVVTNVYITLLEQCYALMSRYLCLCYCIKKINFIYQNNILVKNYYTIFIIVL